MKKYLPYIIILTIAGTILFLTEDYEINQEKAIFAEKEAQKAAVIAEEKRKEQELLAKFSDTEIDSLDLSDLNLDKLPNEFRKLKNLRYLNLSSNKFTDFPSILSDLENLEVLDFSNNDLDIFNTYLPNIKRLNLSNNALRNVFELNANIIKIETLNLSNNQLTKEFSCQSLPNLRTLDISHNEIYNISDLHKLENLRIFDCSFNSLEWVEGFPPKLRIGNFSNNFIYNLHYDDISNISTILEIDFSHNQLTDFPYHSYFKRLQVLKLSENNILDIMPLSDFPSLKNLDISDCSLGELTINLTITNAFKNLESLNLGENNFETITIKNNTLKELDLSNNVFLILDKNSFQTPNLEIINISDAVYRGINSLAEILQNTNLKTIVTNHENICNVPKSHTYLRTNLKNKPEIICL